MIKGVNKQVLEINETQNTFFEKAIFFVKPEYCGMSEGKLRETARSEIEKAGKPPASREKPLGRLKNYIAYFLFLASGILIGLSFSSLL